MRLCALLLFALVLVPAPLAARDDPAAPLSVQIACPARLGARKIDLRALPVVIANRSRADVKVWREWCSWGWFQLSLEIRDDDGQVVTVRKKERGWDKNFPDFWTLAPGEPLVWTANLLDASVWKWSIPAEALRGTKREVRARFVALETDESDQEGTFHGDVTSPWRTYDLGSQRD